MFNIAKKYNSTSKTPLITENKIIFHYDQRPILFAGTNELGNKIVGSLIFEDNDKGIYRHLHNIVTDKMYFDFISRKITYLELIKNCQENYIVDIDANKNPINTYLVPFSVIPHKSLPKETLLCPNVETAVGTIFGFSLKGLISELHEAKVEVVSTVTKAFEKLLQLAMKSIPELELGSEIRELIPVTSSYKINLQVKFEPYSHGMFMYSEEKIIKHITEFVKYSTNGLLQESDKLTSNNITNTLFESQLLANVNTLYRELSIEFTDKARKNLIDKTLESASELSKIAEESGEGFNGIEITVNENTTNPLGYLSEQSFQEIERVSERILTTTDENTSDADYMDYKVWIYHLNTDKRIGNAHIKNFQDSSKTDSPKIRIEGDDDLKSTKYTESLHVGQWIDVKAKATKSTTKFKLLLIKQD
jgi:hypothetical protein